MAIRVVTDSVADLPPALASAHDVTVVPAYVIIGAETYRDGLDISTDHFYEQLGTLPRLPTTSQPTVADFHEVYQRLLDQGHQIVSVHVSSKLSGTFNSATQAKAALGNDIPIEVVDTQLASGPQALAVLDAAEWAREMTDYQDLARRVRQSTSRYQCYVLLDTLEFLKKGGRIGKASAFVGGMLKVKPILTIRDGEVHPVERPRSRDRGMARLIELVRELGPAQRINVSFSTDREQALAMRQELAGLVGPDSLLETRFGSVLGTYLGPNALGVSVALGSDDWP